MQGADLAAVQRIMRHQDPRITTEVYGHLAPGYLTEGDQPPPVRADAADQSATVIPISAAATASGPSGTDEPVHASAGGASEPPLPADAAPAAPRGSVCYPVATQPPDRPCTLDATRRNLERIVAELSCRGERI